MSGNDEAKRSALSDRRQRRRFGVAAATTTAAVASYKLWKGRMTVAAAVPPDSAFQRCEAEYCSGWMLQRERVSKWEKCPFSFHMRSLARVSLSLLFTLFFVAFSPLPPSLHSPLKSARSLGRCLRCVQSFVLAFGDRSSLRRRLLPSKGTNPTFSLPCSNLQRPLD